jgi:uncharacterized coiled-coil protein SlyX
MTLEPRIDRLESEVARISDRVDSLGRGVANLKGQVQQMNIQLGSIESRLTRLEVLVVGSIVVGIIGIVLGRAF